MELRNIGTVQQLIKERQELKDALNVMNGNYPSITVTVPNSTASVSSVTINNREITGALKEALEERIKTIEEIIIEL